MKPNEALAELLDLSSQVEDAAVMGESGFVLASSGTPERGEQLARIAADLVAAAADVRPTGEVTRVEVALGAGSVFVVREGGRMVVATTCPSRPRVSSSTTSGRCCAGSTKSRPASLPRSRKKDVADA